jgi:hypothetical protein
MNNQHAGLSQALAAQRITQRREQATHARLARGARLPRRRKRWAARGWWQLARWPAVAVERPTHRRTASVDRSEPTMSKLARALVLGATLAAMNLAAMTTVAQAQANDEPPSNQDARQPPTEGQVGEAWRHPQVAAEQPTVADDTRRPPTEGQVGEPWHPRLRIPVPPAEPSGQPGWLIPSLGVLAAVLVLAGGLAALAAKRAGRRARVGHAA